MRGSPVNCNRPAASSASTVNMAAQTIEPRGAARGKFAQNHIV
jgi:hypothetical protein